MLKKGLFFLGFIFVIFFIHVYPRIPQNIYCFLDIGTHRPASQFVEVDSQHSYGQTFVPHFNNLFKISLFVPYQKVTSDIFFYLKENPEDKHPLVTVKLAPEDIRPSYHDFHVVPIDGEIFSSGFHVHIPFPTLKHSKGKSFYFYVECPTCPVGGGFKLGMWQTPYYEALAQGNAFLNHKETNGFLAFRTFNTWDSSYSVLIKEIRNRLLQDKLFLTVYLSLFLIIFMTYIRLKWVWKNEP